MEQEIKNKKIDFINNNIKKDKKLTERQKKFESKNLTSKRVVWTEKVFEFYDGMINQRDSNDIPDGQMDIYEMIGDER